jgi:hypothetical protein
MGKKAVIVAELLEECDLVQNGEISAEILRWFREEAVPAPWVKEVTCVDVRDV